MITFKEANSVRTKLKLEFSNYCWYLSSSVEYENSNYYILIMMSSFPEEIKHNAAYNVDGVNIKYEHQKK